MVHFSIYSDDELPGHHDYAIPMFSIPLFHFKVEDWESKKKALLEIYSERVKDSAIACISNKNVLDVETDYHVNYDNEFNYSDDITDIFEDELVAFSNLVNLQIKVNSTWFEKASKYKHHTCHNHGPAGYSAVCFIQFDPKYHTPTVFLNPITAAVNPYNMVPPGIREGSLIFFPSFLLHYTNSNESDVDRIILSFNLETEEEWPGKFEDNHGDDSEYYTTTY